MECYSTTEIKVKPLFGSRNDKVKVLISTEDLEDGINYELLFINKFKLINKLCFLECVVNTNTINARQSDRDQTAF